MWPVRVALKYCLSKNGRYGKNKNGTGVVVMTLTATVYRGNIREIQSSRIGFCGEYNKEILLKWVLNSKRYLLGKLRLNTKLNQ